MADGHTGLSNNPVNQGESGNFKLVLSYVEQSSGSGEFVIHVMNDVAYGFGQEYSQFLSQIGLTQYQGKCPFLHDRCFYQVMATAQRLFPDMQHYTQVEYIHERFKRFVGKIHHLYMLFQQEGEILDLLDLELPKRSILGQPTHIEVQETDIPLWVNEVKFSQLRSFEDQQRALQKEIDNLSQFLPLLYSTGISLEMAVIYALRFFGLNVVKTEKGFTVDIRAQTPDGSKKFGLEVTGINGQIKKDSPKLNQVTQFELIKEYDEKTILVANTHNKTPISQRQKLDDFSPHVLTFFERHPVLLMTSWNLYCMVRDVVEGTRIKEELIEVLYRTNGRLNYDATFTV